MYICIFINERIHLFKIGTEETGKCWFSMKFICEKENLIHTFCTYHLSIVKYLRVYGFYIINTLLFRHNNYLSVNTGLSICYCAFKSDIRRENS